jgi:ABC-type transport system involved in multi-copper enzyme maturation permease subunit
MFVVVSGALLGVFQLLICAAVGSVNVTGALETLVSTLPPLLQSAVGSQLLGGYTAHGLIAFGWNHPIGQAAGAAVAIVLAARAIAGEAERGTIETTLAQPLSRGAYFAAHVGFALAALVLLSAAGVAGSLVGQHSFGLERFPAGAWARLASNYWALHVAWFGVTLAFSAFAREGGRAASAGFMIALVSYVAYVIGALWDRAAFVRPYALNEHFSPQRILVEGAGVWPDVRVLLAVAAVGVAVAWGRFRTRDLP